MRAQRLFPIALSLVLSILMMACKDSPTNPTNNSNDPNALKGTWLLESIDGESFDQDGTIWMFGDGTASVSDAEIGCRQVMSYTVSGNKINGTLTANSCSDEPVGSTNTATWSISNGKLTTVSEGSTSIFRRPAGNDRALGSWSVKTIDGQAPAEGAGMIVYIYGQTFEIFKLKTGASEPCLTSFAMSNTGTRLNVQVVADECGDVEPGATDVFTWSVSGTTITLTLQSSGTVIVAERM